MAHWHKSVSESKKKKKKSALETRDPFWRAIPAGSSATEHPRNQAKQAIIVLPPPDLGPTRQSARATAAAKHTTARPISAAKELASVTTRARTRRRCAGVRTGERGGAGGGEQAVFPSGTNRTEQNNRAGHAADGDGRRARSTPLALPSSSSDGGGDWRPRRRRRRAPSAPWFPAALRPPPRARAQKHNEHVCPR